MTYHGEFLLWSCVFDVLQTTCGWKSTSFSKFEKVSVEILLNILSVAFDFISDVSSTPWILRFDLKKVQTSWTFHACSSVACLIRASIIILPLSPDPKFILLHTLFSYDDVCDCFYLIHYLLHFKYLCLFSFNVSVSLVNFPPYFQCSPQFHSVFSGSYADFLNSWIYMFESSILSLIFKRTVLP